MRIDHLPVLLLAILLLATGCAAGSATRQEEVAERGSQVMPFDLDRTTHVFADKEFGGVQTVTANDPNDIDQLPLIRGHLREETAAFAAGDFDDPGEIHGDAMPGLAELRAGFRNIEVSYQEVPNGGSITYRTSDPGLIEALHRWFDAQSSDHGGAGHE
jgi:hypothetical protein